MGSRRPRLGLAAAGRSVHAGIAIGLAVPACSGGCDGARNRPQVHRKPVGIQPAAVTDPGVRHCPDRNQPGDIRRGPGAFCAVASTGRGTHCPRTVEAWNDPVQCRRVARRRRPAGSGTGRRRPVVRDHRSNRRHRRRCGSGAVQPAHWVRRDGPTMVRCVVTVPAKPEGITVSPSGQQRPSWCCSPCSLSRW